MFPRRLAHCANSALRLPSVTAIVQSPHAPSTTYSIARIHTRSTPLAQTAQAATASSSSTPSLAYTLPPKPSSDVAPYQRSTKRTWHLFDAKDQVVGRMAGRIAHLLVGKHKPDYDPAHDDGDFVVVLNAKHLKFTGKKWEQKLYRYHTGYVGGLKEIPAERWRQSHPDRILKHAVAGMIHKNKLKVPRLNRLKIYSGLVHPHSAQFPFDVIQQVPALKAARDAELAELAAKEQFEKDAINMTTSGGKSKKENASSTEPSSDIQGPDDGTVPNDPDIKKAILKDREERKGKPIVRL